MLRTFLNLNKNFKFLNQFKRVSSFQSKLLLPRNLNRQKILRNVLVINHNKASSSLSSIATKQAKFTKKQILKQLFQFIWPKNEPRVKIRVLFAVSCLILSKLLNVSVPFIFKEIIDFLNIHIDSPNDFKDKLILGLITITCAYGIARIGSALFAELRTGLFARVSQQAVSNLGIQIFKHLHSLDFHFHLNKQTGALAKIIDRGTRGVNFVLTTILFNLIPTLFECAIISGILYFSFGLSYALLSLSSIAAYSAFSLSIIKWRSKFRAQMNQAENEAGSKAVDSLLNYKTVKYFNNEQYEIDKYKELIKKYEASSIKSTTSLALLNLGQDVILSLGLTGIMILAGLNVLNNELTIGDLVKCNALLFQLIIPFNSLGNSYREVRQSVTDMQAMFDLTQIKASTKDTHLDMPNLIISPLEASIVFDRVKFRYNEKDKLFEDLSFEIKPGKTVAIVGGSGSGKSSILRLLYRFYDPLSGQMLINNQNIKSVSLNSLRKSIGVVDQENELFNDTILFNIQYGNLNASLDEVYQAAQTVGIHESIMKLQNGYKTIVGEQSLKLSGGEKQRIAIARVLLKNSNIIVYDEATSSLDSLNEQVIINAIRRNIKNRTTILIAHRLITVLYADEIFVLENGKIVERGSHSQLVNRTSSLYYNLWQQRSNRIKNSL